jgi:hypothetical protein
MTRTVRTTVAVLSVDPDRERARHRPHAVDPPGVPGVHQSVAAADHQFRAAPAIAEIGLFRRPGGGQQNDAIVGGQSGRCVDINGGSTANGARVQLWDCNGGTNQRWTHTANRQLQVYGNKCLDVSGQGTTNGTAAIIWDCHGGTNQQWNLRN